MTSDCKAYGVNYYKTSLLSIKHLIKLNYIVLKCIGNGFKIDNTLIVLYIIVVVLFTITIL